jgi:hypothetical protein
MIRSVRVTLKEAVMSPRQLKTHITHSALLPLLTAAALVATPFLASGGTEIITNVPPPPDRVEHAPPQRDGYVWGAGHWEWNGRAYTWASGTWITERRAAHWVVPRWEPVGAQWHYVAGHWER